MAGYDTPEHVLMAVAYGENASAEEKGLCQRPARRRIMLIPQASAPTAATALPVPPESTSPW